MKLNLSISKLFNILGISIIFVFTFFCDFRLYLFKSTLIAYIFLFIGLVLIFLSQSRTKINIDKIINILVISLIFVLFSPDKGYLVKYLVGFILMLEFENTDVKCIKYAMNILLILGIIFSFFSYLFMFNPDLYLKNIVPLLDDYLRESAMAMARTNRITGLTGHYSTNGIYLAIGFGAAISLYLTCNENQKKKMLFLVSAFILGGLLIIGKRAHLVFSVFAAYTVYWLYNNDKKNKRLLKTIFIIIIAVIGFLIIVQFIPNLSNTFDRFTETYESGDFLMSRGEFYEKALKLFLEKPIFGNGWKSMTKYLQHDVHNVYIQLLAETGIVGFIVYIYIFIYTYTLSVKIFKFILSSKESFSKEQLLCAMFCVYYQTFFLIYSLTGNPLYMEQTLFLYFITLGLILNLKKVYLEVRNEKNSHINISKSN